MTTTRGTGFSPVGVRVRRFPPTHRIASALMICFALFPISGQAEISPSTLLRNLRTKSFGGKVVDIKFEDHTIAQIIREYEKISGLRFEIDPDIPDLGAVRKFTLLGMPWDKSLGIILDSCGLELKAFRNSLRVVRIAERRPTSLFFVGGGLFAAAALTAAVLIWRRLKSGARRSRMEGKYSIGEEDVGTILRGVEHLFSTEKIHRDPDLDLAGLAKRLSLSPKLLSWIFNVKIGSTFSDYVNRIRIEEIKAALPKPGARGRTILETAFDAGYNTKSAFYKAFKHVTGMNPGEFQKRNRRTNS